MPRQVTPATAVPDPVRAAVTAFGTVLRLEILRQLHLEGPRTAAELVALIGANSRTVALNLDALEGAGVIAADHPPGQRNGRRRVTYSLDPDRVTELHTALGAHLLVRRTAG